MNEILLMRKTINLSHLAEAKDTRNYLIFMKTISNANAFLFK